MLVKNGSKNATQGEAALKMLVTRYSKVSFLQRFENLFRHLYRLLSWRTPVKLDIYKEHSRLEEEGSIGNDVGGVGSVLLQ